MPWSAHDELAHIGPDPSTPKQVHAALLTLADRAASGQITVNEARLFAQMAGLTRDDDRHLATGAMKGTRDRRRAIARAERTKGATS